MCGTSDVGLGPSREELHAWVAEIAHFEKVRKDGNKTLNGVQIGLWLWGCLDVFENVF